MDQMSQDQYPAIEKTFCESFLGVDIGCVTDLKDAYITPVSVIAQSVIYVPEIRGMYSS